MSHVLSAQAQKTLMKRPEIRPGFTVRVHQKVEEGGKQRIQIFEGLIVAMHRGHLPTDVSFTVRRVASGVGVEKVFPLYSPLIEKIDVKKVAKVRRAKLNFLRGDAGRNIRLSERFTSDAEFAVAVSVEEPVAEEKDAQSAQEEAPAEKEKETGTAEAKEPQQEEKSEKEAKA